jgi:hypothetical protein
MKTLKFQKDLRNGYFADLSDGYSEFTLFVWKTNSGWHGKVQSDNLTVGLEHMRETKKDVVAELSARAHVNGWS